jgi:hypothetical protein
VEGAAGCCCICKGQQSQLSTLIPAPNPRHCTASSSMGVAEPAGSSCRSSEYLRHIACVMAKRIGDDLSVVYKSWSSRFFGRRARGRPHRMDTASQTLHQGRAPVLSHLFVETVHTRDSACARLAELVSLRSGSFQQGRDALVAAVCTQQLAASATVAADTPALIAELGRSWRSGPEMAGLLQPTWGASLLPFLGASPLGGLALIAEEPVGHGRDFVTTSKGLPCRRRPHACLDAACLQASGQQYAAVSGVVRSNLTAVAAASGAVAQPCALDIVSTAALYTGVVPAATAALVSRGVYDVPDRGRPGQGRPRCCATCSRVRTCPCLSTSSM